METDPLPKTELPTWAFDELPEPKPLGPRNLAEQPRGHLVLPAHALRSHPGPLSARPVLAR